MAKPKTASGGLLIFFDGIDGVGKSTQLQLAQKHLEDDGWFVKTARIHGGTPIGEALREVSFLDLARPASTDLFISLAMHQALIEQTKLWRQDGAIILIDRSPLSIIGYQVCGDGLDSVLGWRSAEESIAGFAPNMTIVYTADVRIALDRTRKKPGWHDYFSSKPDDYFDKAQTGYLKAAKHFDAKIINADQPLRAVQDQTWQLIEATLPA